MYKKVLNSLYTTKVDAIGLSIFRMFYSVVLFLELKQLYTFRSIIYDKEPYKYTGELDVSFVFYFWLKAGEISKEAESYQFKWDDGFIQKLN